MVNRFQTMTECELAYAEDHLTYLEELLTKVASQCKYIIDGYEDMRRECNMILLANTNTFDRVNLVLSMLRKTKNDN